MCQALVQELGIQYWKTATTTTKDKTQCYGASSTPMSHLNFMVPRLSPNEWSLFMFSPTSFIYEVWSAKLSFCICRIKCHIPLAFSRELCVTHHFRISHAPSNWRSPPTLPIWGPGFREAGVRKPGLVSLPLVAYRGTLEAPWCVMMWPRVSSPMEEVMGLLQQSSPESRASCLG